MNNQGSSQKAGTLLLVMTSSLLLCQNVHPLPICHSGYCEMSLWELFDRVTMLSHYIHSLSTEMFTEFDKLYSHDHEFIATAISDCPTSSLATPEDKEQAQQIPPEVLLNLVLSLVHYWNDPLYQLVTEVGSIHEAPDAIISRAKEIEIQNKRLLEGIEKILGQAYPEAKGNEIYSVWSQLPSLQGVDKEARDKAIYNKIRCLRRDSHKIDNFLKFLRCRVVYNNNC